MVCFASLLVVSCVVCYCQGLPTLSNYMSQRENLLKLDRGTRTGSNIQLSSNEQIVSDYMVQQKKKLMEFSRLNKTEYFPSLSFYKSKPLIEKTELFSFFQKMPKGGVLHAHDMSITSLDWVVKNVTYRDNLYMCVDAEHFMNFRFAQSAPQDPACVWKSVKDERAAASSPEVFDESVRRNISYLAVDPLKAYADGDVAWVRFNKYFSQIIGMVFYAPVFRDFFAQALEEFRADNVQYLELRGQIWGTFNLDGSTNDGEFGLNIYKSVAEDFTRRHPDFIGAKFIMTGLRFKPVKDIRSEVQMAMALHKKYPDSMIGYDLVGQEDPNFSLLHYLDDLLLPSQQDPPVHLPYFFHAAETNWQGTAVDYNLVDAYLLNTTRVGHGYGVDKHPYLQQLFRAKKVAFEVNPISNQVLRLLDDLRNHAMIPLLSSDFPIVVSSDDPTAWEALPLSHDMYLTFMTMCGEDADLRIIKQLIMNSLEYSAMSDKEKLNAKRLWQVQWDQYIKEAMIHILSGSFYQGPPTQMKDEL